MAHLGDRIRHAYMSWERLGFYLSLHMLRHAAATHLLSAGADLWEVQELLGHRSISSTHVTPTRLLEVHHLCHPRNNSAGPGTFGQSGNL